jgi:SAM-dependent methyltransferase/septal ring factor EnvC (AmiA/AmiB activator)
MRLLGSVVETCEIECIRGRWDGAEFPYQHLVVALEQPPTDWSDVLTPSWVPVHCMESLCIVIWGDVSPQCRTDLEREFIGRGLRKHPFSNVVARYDDLDTAAAPIVVPFEPVPPSALDLYPAEVLARERDLHMDMTREPGRRSDAHMVRYAHAAQFVRPGDRVLDCACGLGYGSYMLSRLSRASRVQGLDSSAYAVRYAEDCFASAAQTRLAFASGDAERLIDFADGSVDFAISIETLEHLPKPADLLAELMRVLTPGGRAYLSVPNDWSDESGEDPNPHHFHVYDWGRLSAQVEAAGFLVERAWLQDAGGGQKRRFASRALVEIDAATGPADLDAEWLLMLVAKPAEVAASAVPQAGKGPNITAFERDYDNPYLVRSIVAIGLRSTAERVLRAEAARVLKHARPRSADYGAALCVLAYAALRSGEESESLAAQCEAYGNDGTENPTVFRWRVSLGYVAAQMYLLLGDRVAAGRCLSRVADADASEFSPLLGTKTVAARFQLGVLYAADGSVEAALENWRKAVLEVRRLVSGAAWEEVVGPETRRPETFGFFELAEVLSDGRSAAFAIQALDHGRSVDGALWHMISSAPPLALARTVNASDPRSSERSDQADERSWLLRQYAQLSAETARLGKENAALNDAHAWLEAQYHALSGELAARAEQCATLRAGTDALNAAKAWLESQNVQLRDEMRASAGRESALSTELELSVQHGQVLTGEIGRLNQEVRTLRRELSELAEAKAWLSDQYQFHEGELARLRAELEDVAEASATTLAEREGITARLSEVWQAKVWLEQHASALQAACDAAITEARVTHEMLAAAMVERESFITRLRDVQAEVSAHAERSEILVSENQALRDELQRLIESSDEARRRLEMYDRSYGTSTAAIRTLLGRMIGRARAALGRRRPAQ